MRRFALIYFSLILMILITSCNNRHKLNDSVSNEIISAPKLEIENKTQTEELIEQESEIDNSEDLKDLLNKTDIILKSKLEKIFSSLDTSVVRMKIIDSLPKVKCISPQNDIHSYILNHAGLTRLDTIKSLLNDYDTVISNRFINCIKSLNSLNMILNERYDVHEEVILKMCDSLEYNLRVNNGDYFHKFSCYLPDMKMFIFEWSNFEDGSDLMIDIYGNQHIYIPIIDNYHKFYIRLYNVDLYEDNLLGIELGTLKNNFYDKLWSYEATYYSLEIFYLFKKACWFENKFYFIIEYEDDNNKDEMVVELEFAVA